MESVPTYSTIVLKLATMLDTMIDAFTAAGYNAVSNYLRAPIGLLCVLYIVLTGYAIMLGFSDKPANDFKKVVLRIGLVYMFALNWGTFSAYGVDLFTTASTNLGAAIIDIVPFDFPFLTNAIGIKGALQTVLIEVSKVGQWIMNKGSFYNPTPWITGMGIIGFGGVVVVVAFMEIFVAKLIIAVCFCLAPLFITLTLFDKTRAFFDRWLGTLVGYSLIFVFVSAVLGVCMHLVHFTVAGHFISKALHVTFTDWIPVAFMAVISVKALLDVAGIAKGIGGACQAAGTSAMVGGFVGAAMGASRSGGSATKQIAGKGMSALSKLTPNGAIAQMGMAAAQKMAQGGSTAMKSIQSRMRSGGPIKRTFRGE